MKKNLLLSLSMVLILCMFGSMCFVAFFGKKATIEESNINENIEQNLRINISKEPSSLHPGLAEDVSSSSVLLQTFEGLTRIDSWGQTVNAAAKIIKISDDQKTYTFTLRDTNWSNGDPVIAEDFEYAWKWALNPSNHSPSANQLYYIQGAKEFNKGNISGNKVGVKALDKKTLQVRLVNPIPNFLQLTAMPTYFPINSKIARRHPDWANDSGNYPSNGPFKLSKWKHNNKIVIEKNDNYWDSGVVRLKKITMVMINDPLAELTMFEKGKLDWAGGPAGHLPSDGLGLFVDNDKVDSQQVTGDYAYKFNTKIEPFNNENIRKAFALSINRQKLIDTIGLKGLSPAKALVPPSLFPENKKGYFKDGDVEAAKKYLQKGLEELGYHDVSQLPSINLGLNLIDGERKISQAEEIQKMWKNNLGVEVTIKDISNEKADKSINIFDYEVPLIEWIGYYNDPLNYLEMHQDDAKLGVDGTNWKNERFQLYLKKAQTEVDPNKRQTLLKHAENILLKEMPVIPIYYFSNCWVQNKNLNGVTLSGLSHLQFKWAYFKED